jgi:hypothetical protein
VTRSTIVTSVVKMKLNTWCKSDLIAGEISRLAEGLARVSVETSRFLNFWAASSLDEWESIPKEQRKPIPKLDQKFLYRAHTRGWEARCELRCPYRAGWSPYVFLYEIEYGVRPFRFTREFQMRRQ